MAMLKELDFIAITDHNSLKQLETVRNIETSYNFIYIPGVEVTVKEGFDVLCYFKDFDTAKKFDTFLETYLTDDWGPFNQFNQIITDIYDNEIDTFDKPLLKTTLPHKKLYQKVSELGGIAILAHVDRKSKSAMLVYDLKDIPFDGIEIQPYEKQAFIDRNSALKNYKIICNSDSHTLLTISERIEFLELEEKSIDAFFKYFKGA